MIPPEKVIVALDTQDPEKLKKILDSIKGTKVWVKIGMELFYSLGPQAIHEAKDRDLKVFLDLKLHDIPTTVAHSLEALVKLPIDMINVHAAGGSEMLKMASDVVKSSAQNPLLIAVTQLTSTTQIQVNDEQHITGSLEESVVHYAQLARMFGCDGVVCAPQEVMAIKKMCSPEFITVTPGIRPLGTSMNDQKRVTTPMDALRLGTDYMVIGRPITQNPSPLVALVSILKGS